MRKGKGADRVVAGITLAAAALLLFPAVAPGQSGEYELLWHRYLADPIYTTTAVSDPAKMVLAGNWCNPPKEAEAIPLFGDGTPDWVFPGTEFYVDASRQAEVVAGLDYTSADSTVTVMEWQSNSAVPLWTYRIHPCRALDANGWSAGKGVQVSDDGSTISVVVNMFTTGGLKARLYVFDAGSSTPVVSYDLPGASAASALAITPQGSYVAVYAWPSIYVYDRPALALRWSGSCGAGNDALAISGDGRYLSWGWSTVYLREWTGSTYQQIWSTTRPGMYASECALSIDGSTLAVGWYEYPSFARTVIEVRELPSLSLLWEYDYVAAGASDVPADRERITDVPSEMVWSTDSQHLAVASWGGNFPEIHVFGRAVSTPLAVMDTPGTMFDIDVVTTQLGETYVSACGKHVHAGQSGRGADLYALVVHGWADVADGSEDGAPSGWPGAGLLGSWPNPTSAHAAIAFELASAGPARLGVYDVSGRLVRMLLDGPVSGGRQEASWDGTDTSGTSVASGLYVARLEAGGAVRHHKMVVLR